MKKHLKTLAGMFALAIMLVSMPTPASAQHAVTSVPFQKVVHYCGTTAGSGSFSGRNYSNCKAIADGDVYAIEANTVITKVWMVIDTALTGTTALTLGDDDDADGYATNPAALTAGMYFWSPGAGGAYTQEVGAGGANFPDAKYYSAAGKEIKLDVTTANTAGRFRVIIEGYKIPAAP